MDDVRDFHRIDHEIRDLEKTAHGLLDDCNRLRDTLKKQEGYKLDLEADDRDLRELFDMAKRWCDDGTKIAEKRMSIVQKQLDLNTSLPETGRDLKTVERDIAKKSEEKEETASKISSLLKTQQAMMNKISSLSGLVCLS
jgi:chromosome segregation ATPase